MNCKICGSNHNDFLFNAKNCKLYKCANCNFVFVNPLPSDKEINLIYKSEYFDKGKYIEDYATLMEYKRRKSLIENITKNPINILDYGCASGDFVNYISANFGIYGIDYSDDAIKLAKNKYSKISNRFFYFDEFDSIDLIFDVIVLWDVIEHVKDPLNTINMLKKKLTNNGVIILSTPNIGAGVSKIMRSKWAFMTPPEHLCFFEKKSINELIKKTDGQMISWTSKGKWVNIAFLFYKVKRIFPKLIPQFFVNFLKKYFNKVSVYIPTLDILYTSIKFKGKNDNL